jgi:hypothetical protein
MGQAAMAVYSGAEYLVPAGEGQCGTGERSEGEKSGNKKRKSSGEAEKCDESGQKSVEAMRRNEEMPDGSMLSSQVRSIASVVPVGVSQHSSLLATGRKTLSFTSKTSGVHIGGGKGSITKSHTANKRKIRAIMKRRFDVWNHQAQGKGNGGDWVGKRRGKGKGKGSAGGGGGRGGDRGGGSDGVWVGGGAGGN